MAKKKKKVVSFTDVLFMIWNWAWMLFKTVLRGVLGLVKTYPKIAGVLVLAWLLLRYMNHDEARIQNVAEIVVLGGILFVGYLWIKGKTKKK